MGLGLASDRLQFSFQDGVKFVSIGAMFSELVAVSSKGELYQWKWSEPEPYRNAQVEDLFCHVLYFMPH